MGGSPALVPTGSPVQAPDPFLKRILAVACREVLDFFQEKGVPIGFKDLGAGGIAMHDHDDAGLVYYKDGFVDFQVTLRKGPKRFPDNVGCCLRRVLAARVSDSSGARWDGNIGDGPLRGVDDLDAPVSSHRSMCNLRPPQ